MNRTNWMIRGVILGGVWLLAWSFPAAEVSAQSPQQGSSFQGRRTPLVDGQPLVNRRPQKEPENLFSWFARQGRRLAQATRNFFAPPEPTRRTMRPGRMKFPYLGNRPATKQKKPSFWSRWWPWGSQRK